MDTELRYTRRFKLHGADIAQRLMQALPIVERLDELKHRRSRFVAGVEALLMNPLVLQCTEEAFDHRIVETIALAAHARDQATLGQQAVVGHDIVEAYGGRVCIMAYVDGVSTTEIIGHIVERYRS